MRTTERRCAHRAHSPLRLGSHWLNSYIPPEPKRCVERKALNCLMRIIAKLPPFVGVILQKFAKANLRLRAFFRGKGRPLLYPILPPRGEISRRNISETISGE